MNPTIDLEENNLIICIFHLDMIRKLMFLRQNNKIINVLFG
jgi:hypothetical protein